MLDDQFKQLNDKEFLNWLYERLKYQHKERDDSHYMKRFAAIIDQMERK